MKSTERNEFVVLQERIAKLELAIGVQGLSFTQMALTLGDLVGQFRSVMSDLVTEMKAENLRNAERDVILRTLISALGGAVPEQKPTSAHKDDDFQVGAQLAMERNARDPSLQKETPTG